MEINLAAHYQAISAELRAAELRAAALQGQLDLIERLIAEAQQPQLSGDPLEDSPCAPDS